MVFLSVARQSTNLDLDRPLEPCDYKRKHDDNYFLQQAMLLSIL